MEFDDVTALHLASCMGVTVNNHERCVLHLGSLLVLLYSDVGAKSPRNDIALASPLFGGVW